jgi:hypothetical protein
MASAKRRINSTGRKRIERERAEIRLDPAQPLEPLSAHAAIDLEGLDFPDDAVVILEAYQRSAGMRFGCGTVGALRIPSVLRLDEIDRGAGVLFRLKVIDGGGRTGKILGSAERLRPASNENVEGKRSIFPIREDELHDDIWRVTVDESGPWLWLNYRIPGFKHRILENPLLQGVMLPAAFRIVLEHLVNDPVPDDDDPNDWRGLWLRFLREAFAIDDDLSELATDEEERRAWIESAVQTFCAKHDFVGRIRAAAEEGA